MSDINTNFLAPQACHNVDTKTPTNIQNIPGGRGVDWEACVKINLVVAIRDDLKISTPVCVGERRDMLGLRPGQISIHSQLLVPFAHLILCEERIEATPKLRRRQKSL